jgi:hypothetical protein
MLLAAKYDGVLVKQLPGRKFIKGCQLYCNAVSTVLVFRMGPPPPWLKVLNHKYMLLLSGRSLVSPVPALKMKPGRCCSWP